MKSANQILVDSLLLLNTHGWIKNKIHTEEGYCAVGAIRKAASDDIANDFCENFIRAYNALCKVVSTDGQGYPRSRIMDWNDLPSTNKEKVFEAFTIAITSTM
jgi:hypothetical protein